MSPEADGLGRLLLVGLSRETASLQILERASLGPPAARRLLRGLRDAHAVDEVLALSTCNRTEVYAVARTAAADGPDEGIRRTLARHTNLSKHELTRVGYCHDGQAAVEHFFGVVAGLDSAVLGEPEIVAQVRAAAALADEVGTLDRVLTGLVDHGLAAGRRVRRSTAISRGAVSVSSVAVDLAETLVEDLARRRVLMIGAGQIARALTRRLVSRGVRRVVVANRSAPPALALARDAGGSAVGLGALGEELPRADLVVCATGAASHLVTEPMLRAATSDRRGQLIVLDLAVPRDVEPAAHDLPGVVLHDIDEIHRIAAAHLDSRRRELPRAWSIVRAEGERFRAWRAGLDAEAVLTELRRRAEEIRDLELARALADSPALEEAELARLDAVTRSLVNKLLHEPTHRIRRAGTSSRGRAHIDALRELFGLVNDDAAAGPSRREHLSLLAEAGRGAGSPVGWGDVRSASLSARLPAA